MNTKKVTHLLVDYKNVVLTVFQIHIEQKENKRHLKFLYQTVPTSIDLRTKHMLQYKHKVLLSVRIFIT